ncbi:uncharacterized protein EAE98_006783 [Botrytis deweyae]|uniref:Uncharacterized protein n=1 Tax=Botrytis deweyae TaxID=2478750 RepID=A0ABQ7IJJ8_9HELO|nr:uncharacterized protein EAE98_006783 [Botrytis deweyae]KAF7925558.1 hypothetical protein EAE98_006783 [Botrytis deweyae]
MASKYQPDTQSSDLSWLCSEGPYLEFIKSLKSRNPSIYKPDPKNHRIGSRVGTSRSVALNVCPDHTVTSEHFKNVSELKNHFAQRVKDDGKGEPNKMQRVYILEGLDPQFIEAYGSYFFMNPMFFARQGRNTIWDMRDIQEGFSDSPPLPSLENPDKCFRLKYREMRKFGPEYDHWRTICATSGSHVSGIGFEYKLDSLAAVERKCSFWFRDAADNQGGWDAVILCEPPVHKVYRARSLFPQEIKNELFQGGYMDFLDLDVLIRDGLNGALDGPPRTCMFDDLCFYFEHHSPLLFEMEGATPPLIASAFLKKIVASHYMKLIDYFEIIVQRLKRAEGLLSRQTDKQDYNSWPEQREQWSSLQLTHRFLSEYSSDIQYIIQTLRISTSPPYPTHYLSSTLDFPFIHNSLSNLYSRVTTIISSTQGLSSIVANREALHEARLSVREAKNSKTLTFIGLVFIPLAYTSALFSMSGEYRPGGEEFWVYWVTSVPIMVLVFAVTWAMQFEWDERGGGRWWGRARMTGNKGGKGSGDRNKLQWGEKK